MTKNIKLPDKPLQVCVHTCRNRNFPWNYFLCWYDPLLMWQNERAKHNKYCCPVWLPMHERDRVQRKPEISSHCHLSQGGQSLPRRHRTVVRADGCVCPLCVHPEGSMIYRQEFARKWEWVAGGGWGESLPSSISRKYTKEALTQKSPSPYLPHSL